MPLEFNKEQESQYQKYQTLIDKYEQILYPVSSFHDYHHSCWYLSEFTFCIRFTKENGLEQFWVKKSDRDDVYSNDKTKWLTLDDVIWNLSAKHVQLIFDGWKLFREVEIKS